MGTKVAEIFADISLDMAKIVAQNAQAKSVFASTASDIQKRLDEIRRAADFSVKIQNLEGVTNATKVLNTLTDQITSLRRQMRDLNQEKVGILTGAGFSQATAERFGMRAGMPPAVGGGLTGEQNGAIAGIEARRIDILRQTKELLAMQMAAESKLKAEQVARTQAILAQARAEDTGRAARLANNAAIERAASLQGFLRGVIDQTTTAEERQRQFTERLNESWRLGLIPIANYARAQEMAGNLKNFQAGGNMGKSNLGFILQQASFGMQDFVTVMSMGGGFNVAMMSASNNIAQMMALISPMTGAIGGAAVTLGMSLIPMLFKTGAEAKAATSEIDNLIKGLSKLDEFSSARAKTRKAADVDDVDSLKGAKRGLNDAEREAKEADIRLAELKQKEGMARAGLLMRQRVEFSKKTVAEGPGFEFDTDQISRMLGRDMTFMELQKLGASGRFNTDTERVQFDQNTGRTTVTTQPAEESRKKILEDIRAIETEINNKAGDKQAAETRINELKKKGQELAEKELRQEREREQLIKQVQHAFGLSDKQALELGDKSVAARARSDEIEELEKRGVISPKTSRQLQRKEEQELGREAREISDRDMDREDAKNKAYSERRIARDKRERDLRQDVEGNAMGKKAQEAQQIRSRLEDRRDEIMKISEPGERNRLLGLAAKGASRELAALKPIGGEKTSVTGFADAMQKGIFGGDMSKDMAATAKNTETQKTLTQNLITEVQKIVNGGMAP